MPLYNVWLRGEQVAQNLEADSREHAVVKLRSLSGKAMSPGFVGGAESQRTDSWALTAPRILRAKDADFTAVDAAEQL